MNIKLKVVNPWEEIIHYVQYSTEIPIEFYISDYEIPQNATARFYLKKPSGKEIYNECSIDGQTVTLQPTAQTFAESGRQAGQIQIVIADKILVSYIIHFDIERNLIEESAIPSGDEFGILEEIIKNAAPAVAAANAAAQQASAAASNADTATITAEKAATAANTAAEDADNKVKEIDKKVADGDFDGVTFTPSVSAAGVISWTNDKGKENPPAVNIKGPKGDTGSIENLDEQPIANVVDKNSIGSLAVIPAAAYRWGNWREPGFLVITLPQFNSNLIQFAVDIGVFDDAQARYNVQGRVTTTNSWAPSTTVYSMGISDKSVEAFENLPVAFGKTAANKPAVIIGTGKELWQNVNVVIRDFSAWGSGADDILNDWRNGWAIEVEPAFDGTVDFTRNNPRVSVPTDGTVNQLLTNGNDGPEWSSDINIETLTVAGVDMTITEEEYTQLMSELDKI